MFNTTNELFRREVRGGGWVAFQPENSERRVRVRSFKVLFLIASLRTLNEGRLSPHYLAPELKGMCARVATPSDIAIYSHSMNEDEEDGRERERDKKKTVQRRRLLFASERGRGSGSGGSARAAARPAGRRLKSLPLTRGHRTGPQK